MRVRAFEAGFDGGEGLEVGVGGARGRKGTGEGGGFVGFEMGVGTWSGEGREGGAFVGMWGLGHL